MKEDFKVYKQILNSQKLLPCPFCGKYPIIKGLKGKDLETALQSGVYLHCERCNFLFGYDLKYAGLFKSEAVIIEAWNAWWDMSYKITTDCLNSQ